MSTPLPPIYRDCHRLLVHTENMVRRFSRYHKYTVGTDLRQGAMQVMRAVNQAVHDQPRQAQHLQSLVWRIDEYKLTLQLGMDVGAFAQSVKGGQRGKGSKEAEGSVSPSFHAFEQAATLAAAVGKQCGGWRQAVARRQRANEVATEGGNPNGGAGPKPQPSAAARPVSLSGHASSGRELPEGNP